MIEVGLLGLDTSHPEQFAKILRSRTDATISSVWDGGDVRDQQYASAFCAAHDAALYDKPHAMIDDVDAVMILTLDWTSHRQLAVPFLEAGIPVLIDKPLAGSIADIDAIDAAAKRGGARVFGGSAVPFHPEFTALADMNSELVLCSGFGDPFYYGVHLVDSMRALVGTNWTRIEPRGGAGTIVTVEFDDESTVTVRFDGSESESVFRFLCVGDEITTVTIENTLTELERMYDPFINEFVATIHGERDERDRLVDGGRLLVGAHAALETGETVHSSELSLASASSIDSSEFVSNYEPYY